MLGFRVSDMCALLQVLFRVGVQPRVTVVRQKGPERLHRSARGSVSLCELGGGGPGARWATGGTVLLGTMRGRTKCKGVGAVQIVQARSAHPVLHVHH